MSKLALPKEKLYALVKDDVMNDPTLENISADLRSKAIDVALELTDPKKQEFVELSLIAKSFVQFRFEMVTKGLIKQTTQFILRALKSLNFQPEVQYTGVIEEGKKGAMKARGKVYLKQDILNSILFSEFFPHDPTLHTYFRCCMQVFASYRKFLEGSVNVSSKKRQSLERAAAERRRLRTTVEAVGVNSNFGVVANVDKKILHKLAGPGNQRQIIQQARGDDAPIRGSCSRELNPGSQAFREYVLERTKHAIQNDSEFQTTPDPALKRAKICKIADDFLEQQNPRFANTTDEENARLVYDPARIVELEVGRIADW